MITYARSVDVVWRVAPDRVLVRRVDGSGPEPAADLMGAAALVWAALDRPATADAIGARILGELGDVTLDINSAITALVAVGWIATVAT